MGRQGTTSLFLLGKDYHLGDLLWLTAVIAEYRRQKEPATVIVGCPDRPVNRILERSPIIDEVIYGSAVSEIRRDVARRGGRLVVHDLRPNSLALAMLKDSRYRLPWLYYRDLWMQPRGQWLATHLRLGQLRDYRPVLQLADQDREMAAKLPKPYVLLAPHIGEYKLAATRALWRRIKGWEWANWIQLTEALQALGVNVMTLAAPDQTAVPGTRPLMGLPITQVAGLIEGAAAHISGESGLWFIAAAVDTPFIIVPWWLPRPVNWASPMGARHRLVYRDESTVENVAACFLDLQAIDVLPRKMVSGSDKVPT